MYEGSPYSGGAITHQVEANVYYKGHVKRIRMDVCNLGKTEVILKYHGYRHITQKSIGKLEK